MAVNSIITDLQKDRLNAIDARTQEIGFGTKIQELSSTANAKGASLIGIEDAASLFTGTSVEDALAELAGAGGIQVDLIFKAATELTIASGAIAATQAAHTIDTESDAASDDLDSITGGTAEEIIFLRAANAARTVVLKHAIGANLIACPAGRDISLAESTDFAALYHNGTQWLVVGFSTLAKGGGGIGNALASTANALGASLVGIEDSGGIITATTVEGALAEIQTDLNAAELKTALITNAGAGVVAKLALAEDTANGAHKSSIQPVASLAADRTITLPDADVALADVNTLMAERTAVATDVGMLYHVRIRTAGGATADTDKALPTGTWEFIDAFVVNRAAGTASDTLQIKKTATAITNAIDISGADNTVARAGTIDDAQISLIGGTDLIRCTETDGAGNDSPAVDVQITLRKIA